MNAIICQIVIQLTVVFINHVYKAMAYPNYKFIFGDVSIQWDTKLLKKDLSFKNNFKSASGASDILCSASS